jgi:hypothetical protein
MCLSVTITTSQYLCGFTQEFVASDQFQSFAFAEFPFGVIICSICPCFAIEFLVIQSWVAFSRTFSCSGELSCERFSSKICPWLASCISTISFTITTSNSPYRSFP